MTQHLQGNDKKELIIEAQIKSIVQTMLENCKVESESKSLKFPLEDYEDRVAYYTGLQKEALRHLLHDPNAPKDLQKSYDYEQHVAIMKALLDCYQSGHLPKYKDVFEKVKHLFPDHNIEQFRYAMTSMGFNYRKTMNGLMIVEDAKLTFERFNYLKKIKSLRKKAPVYYIEEIYIDKNLNFNKPDFAKDARSGNNDGTLILDGFYFYHVLSNAGLDNYFITNKICRDEYRRWVFNILLKIFKPGCAIIIIDGHPLHGELEDETITPYHSKADMLNWLRKRNIPCSNNMFKAELYELISRCNHNPTPGYDLDRWLKAHGHEVVRVPTGFNDLSPTPLFWAEVAKNKPTLPAECTEVDIEEAIIPVIESTHRTCWKALRTKINLCEAELSQLHFDTEAAIENLEPFDVKNIDSHANIPEYFYVLDMY